ncbi:Homocysteine S-methyltransferase [Amylocarpus encephaloides]|uniref:Homocysteine S-methyltransferase n=1 Tax=Amylocarpus encephaloides TaxID=45428 RepID=A0A9P8C9L8_9HELO|nr:Homocysteine S-methyltransferase [Amylocarpus encephaloides]
MSTTPIRVMDGGLGTLLTSPPHSIAFDTRTPLWSSHLLLSESGEGEIRKAQLSFVEAGADLLLSATYQASFEGFAATKISRESDGVGEVEAGTCMRRAVGIARECLSIGIDKKDRGRRGSVVLSLGAYGATMVPSTEYSGSYDESHRTMDQLRDWHLRRLGVFLPNSSRDERTRCWDDVDMVAFETLPLANEILAAREAMGSLSTEILKPFWVSCVFPGEDNVLPDGSSVKDMVEAMLGTSLESVNESQVTPTPDAIGLNCTKVERVESLVLEMETAVNDLLQNLAHKGQSWPALVVYPDGTKGEVYNTTTKEWEMVGVSANNKTPWDEQIFAIVERARERGRWKEIIVGGCCKATPGDISRLRRRVDSL